MFVEKIIEAPIPCTPLNTRSTRILREITAAADAAANMMIPVLNMSFLSSISANLPKVTARQEQTSIYTVITQPMFCALSLNSFSIDGMERFRALPINVVMNEVITAMNRIFLCSFVRILSVCNFFSMLFMML